ncbi:MAG TPA: alpha-glucan family phosphorylase [Thermoanaerobaculia bacterium]|nr:alpha-glucan family phosphorylase [Thermoanaerobaculia bacterium]
MSCSAVTARGNMDVMTAVDPVCGMPVDEECGLSLDHAGQVLWFCADFCKQQFVRRPAAYQQAEPRVRPPLGWPARRLAYFTMEVALANELPTYSGGLGVLAGDTLRSLADLEVPVVGVSLVHRKGYFQQELRKGRQVEHDAPWQPERTLDRVEPVVEVEVEGRSVRIAAWRYELVGAHGFVVPVLLLDTDLPENRDDDRRITDHLYGGDQRYRLIQEVVLGAGGIRMLRALGCSGLTTYHLNEGHASLAPLELLVDHATSTGNWDFKAVRQRMVFTTHTPVEAGHDQFDRGLVRSVLGDRVPSEVLDMLGGRDRLNMTLLALNLSRYVNGVAHRHREVSNRMFPGYEIRQITNGVHSRTWTSDPFKGLFDRWIPGWREDPFMLRNAIALPAGEVWDSHQQAKDELLSLVRARTGRRLRSDVLTIGFARRATAYKRPQLALSDLRRLLEIARKHRLQILFAGKAHPKDEAGKSGIAGIVSAARELGEELPIVYLEGYDLDLALRLVSGCDVWLNTPQPPLEASGTSGMKAAHNGVPSFSVLDGWWREGHVEGATGWSIGAPDAELDEAADAADLYDKLERCILPLFYDRRESWIHVMRQCIALNASFFNTHRMASQYLLHAYALGEEWAEADP